MTIFNVENIINGIHGVGFDNDDFHPPVNGIQPSLPSNPDDTDGSETKKSATLIQDADPEYGIEWIEQFGTNQRDKIFDITNDSNGNTYVLGETNGNLVGQRVGNYDAFIRAYDSQGNILWEEQFGSKSSDQARAINIGEDGYLYMTGSTSADLPGKGGTYEGSHVGNWDVWYAKYTLNGSLVSVEQFGSTANDYANGLTVDSVGNLYLVGKTNGILGSSNAGNTDAFITKRNSNGTIEWTHQFGEYSGDSAEDVALDSQGNVYVTGTMKYSDVGIQSFLTKYTSDGNLVWTERFENPIYSEGVALEIDENDNIYMLGEGKGWFGDTYSGDQDIFLAQYNTDGNQLWIESLGSHLPSKTDYAGDLDVDENGLIYFSGSTSSAMPGQTKAGSDAFWGVYDSQGNLLELEQLGTKYSATKGYGISADNNGNVYMGGYTSRSLPGETSAGNSDGYIAKYSLTAGIATEGNDLLYGENGVDVINGLGGNDTLIGGAGSDTLTGGNGSDTFVIAKGEGTDTITDFIVGEDLIGLSGGLTYNDLSFSNSDIISGYETLATLTGVDTNTLTASDFTVV